MLSFHFGPGREGRTSSSMQTQTSDSSQPCTAGDHNGEIYASIDESVYGNEDKVTADSLTYETGKYCVLWIVRLYIWGKKNNREYDIDNTFTAHTINFSGTWQIDHALFKYHQRGFQKDPFRTRINQGVDTDIVLLLFLRHFILTHLIIYPLPGWHFKKHFGPVHLRIIYHCHYKMCWHLVDCLYVYFLLFYDAVFEKEYLFWVKVFWGPRNAWCYRG